MWVAFSSSFKANQTSHMLAVFFPAKNLFSPPLRIILPSTLLPPAPLYMQRSILMLINVQYVQNIVFGLDKGSNGQNHFSSGSHHHIKFSFRKIFHLPPLRGNAPPLPFGKPWSEGHALSNGSSAIHTIQFSFLIFFLVCWHELI